LNRPRYAAGASSIHASLPRLVFSIRHQSLEKRFWFDIRKWNKGKAYP